MASPSRIFTAEPAIRRAVPMWIGIVGSSGSGKTYSALRLATGMAKVYGDGVSVIDTEARRSSHYADQFRFNVVDFKPPFGPLDYLEAIKHCVGKGSRTIVIDSMSHEWEGEGGVLEQHDQECDRLVKQWNSTRDKVQMAAWQHPKGDHRRLLSYMVQSGVNFILCYRAKEKLKVIPGKQPLPLGWQPVGPDDLVYEATLNMLLLPGCKGVPQWSPAENAEKALLKLPGQFEALFKERRALDEATGEALAKWAAGSAAGSSAATPPAVAAPTAGAAQGSPQSPPADRASAASLEALSAQLGANGLTTKEDKRIWVWNRTGMTLAQLTETACLQAIERAETEAVGR